MRRASVNVPAAPDGFRYCMRCVETGEILECSDLAPLLRKVAEAVSYLKPPVPGQSRLDTHSVAEMVLTYRLELIT